MVIVNDVCVITLIFWLGLVGLLIICGGKESICAINTIQ